MIFSRFGAYLLPAALVICGVDSACAQDYPTKPVRIVTSAAGGGGDLVTRLIAQTVAAPLGQQVIVDNRGGLLSVENVAKAPVDGYTLLSMPNNFWFLPFMQTVSYDPVRDFVPIAMTVSSPNVLVVHPSMPVRSVQELIAFAKARPGQLNFAGGSTGSSSHLAAALFNVMAGIQVVHVPYKGAAAALNDTIAGAVHFAFSNMGGAGAHIKSGRLRALGVTSPEPSALAPGLPTIAASGLRGFESAASYGMYAPAGTPVAIINRMNQELVRGLNRPEAKQRFFTSGVEVVVSSAEQLGVQMKSEIARMGKIIRDAGIRAE